jgi:hypothetical protein
MASMKPWPSGLGIPTRGGNKDGIDWVNSFMSRLATAPTLSIIKRDSDPKGTVEKQQPVEETPRTYASLDDYIRQTFAAVNGRQLASADDLSEETKFYRCMPLPGIAFGSTEFIPTFWNVKPVVNTEPRRTNDRVMVLETVVALKIEIRVWNTVPLGMHIGMEGCLRFELFGVKHWSLALLQGASVDTASKTCLMKFFTLAIVGLSGLDNATYETEGMMKERTASAARMARGRNEQWIHYADWLCDRSDPREAIVRDHFEPGWRKVFQKNEQKP